jgi:hypothetical protein
MRRKNWNWPKSLPALTAKDLCRDELDNEKGQRCLLGWAFYVVSGDSQSWARSWAQSWEGNKILKTMEKRLDAGSDVHDIADYNNDNKHSLSVVAKFWNSTIRAMGYVKKGNLFVKLAKQVKVVKK